MESEDPRPQPEPIKEPSEEERLRAQLLEEIQQEQTLARALLDKAEQMLKYPLATTTHVTDHKGRAVVTEIHPAKWSMADAVRLYNAAKELLERSEGRQRELGRFDVRRLPEWVPTYLAAWGSTRPDGKAMTVIWAASLAGTKDNNVRILRKRSPQFRRMEDMARFGTARIMGEYIDAGLRGNVPTIFGKFMQLVDEGNVQAVLKGVEWARGKPIKHEVEVTGAPQTHIYIPDNRREPTDAPEVKSTEEEETVDAAVIVALQSGCRGD